MSYDKQLEVNQIKGNSLDRFKKSGLGCVGKYVSFVVEDCISVIRSRYFALTQGSYERKLEEQGVYASLDKLANEGTSWDKVQSDLIAKLDFKSQEAFADKVNFMAHRIYTMKQNDVAGFLVARMYGPKFFGDLERLREPRM